MKNITYDKWLNIKQLNGGGNRLKNGTTESNTPEIM